MNLCKSISDDADITDDVTTSKATNIINDVPTCISTTESADILWMTLQEVSNNHVNVLVFIFSPTSNETQVLASGGRAVRQRLLLCC